MNVHVCMFITVKCMTIVLQHIKRLAYVNPYSLMCPRLPVMKTSASATDISRTGIISNNTRCIASWLEVLISRIAATAMAIAFNRDPRPIRFFMLVEGRQGRIRWFSKGQQKRIVTVLKMVRRFPVK